MVVCWRSCQEAHAAAMARSRGRRLLTKVKVHHRRGALFRMLRWSVSSCCHTLKMPKHGFLTPKAISNRIKSKGLQKLRWYCQMCQKQCRDEVSPKRDLFLCCWFILFLSLSFSLSLSLSLQNGFKCHMMSESHQRQMLLVAENPGRYIGAFSQWVSHSRETLYPNQRFTMHFFSSQRVLTWFHAIVETTVWWVTCTCGCSIHTIM